MQSGNDPEEVWSSIASACESGIDFSSRWFATEGQNACKVFLWVLLEFVMTRVSWNSASNVAIHISVPFRI